MLDSVKCTGCGACVSVCPKNAVKLQSNDEGFLYPKISTDKCVECGLCEKKCIAINSLQMSKPLAAYCSYNNDLDVRLASSSGGLFYLMAKSVIQKGGVVFGAVFDGKFKVVHTYAETLSESKPMMGSKYVQSFIGDSYVKAKEFLQRGRFVYFSGTPCQTAGLRAFLGKDYANLICQDLLCHGAPSPKVWQSYIQLRSKKAGFTPRRIAFRAKPWKLFSVLFSYENNTEYRCVYSKDTYMRLFLNNVSLRRSCYDCPAKGHSGSDITLGDYWGVGRVHPEMDDDNGTSLVILNSEKGVSLFEEIVDCTRNVPTQIPQGGMYWNSVKCPRNRKRFFNEYDASNDVKSVETVLLRYGKEPLKQALKAFIIKIMPISLFNALRAMKNKL